MAIDLEFLEFPLFRIEWKLGPVVPDLYHSIKDRRDKPVRPLVSSGLEAFDDDEESFVELVYDAYKNHDGKAILVGLKAVFLTLQPWL